MFCEIKFCIWFYAETICWKINLWFDQHTALYKIYDLKCKYENFCKLIVFLNWAYDQSQVYWYAENNFEANLT